MLHPRAVANKAAPACGNCGDAGFNLMQVPSQRKLHEAPPAALTVMLTANITDGFDRANK